MSFIRDFFHVNLVNPAHLSVERREGGRLLNHLTIGVIIIREGVDETEEGLDI